mgnify:CR=1 FL=1
MTLKLELPDGHLNFLKALARLTDYQKLLIELYEKTDRTPIEDKKLSALIRTEKANIRANKAKEVLAEMLESGKDVSEYIKADDLKGMSDDDLKVLCQGAIDANPKAVEDIKNGKDKAINVMFGYVMKNSKGKADVGKASQIIKEIIANM